MPEITQNITLSILNSKGEMFKNSAGVTYTFQVNPNKLDISDEVQVVESQFLRQDGGIVRPTQVKLRKISGSGKFMDVPVGTQDNYPLVAKGTKSSAFDAYQDLVRYMKTKSAMRMFHQYIGEIYVIIQTLSISNTPSPNTVDFTFSFIETMVDSGRTGFERDKNQQVPGMAVSSNADTVQYDTYTVVSGDTLSRIALKFYGTASKWGIIFDYNLGVLVNGPNKLQVGWVLKIPKSDSAPRKTTGGVTPKTQYSGSLEFGGSIASAIDSLYMVPPQSNYEHLKEVALMVKAKLFPATAKVPVLGGKTVTGGFCPLKAPPELRSSLQYRRGH